ncbi:MAG: hypothetical protein DKM50_12100 [Candidatus Margulisiibacteriota bacterium]|nr:MAG: hypothetical protein A2X43_00895 [Candidatus Margulisbacteria bacterium GWD2_39_127]OGI02388.1 MAG: hypothetical protein A2X42_09545 [Candidatus Margulisbacteria bacterium GWF2_38_17]PZM78169.1 MAG: hypothetical protein DKM50_12100 [Candidatus Margulisiibacteriota bacterium]HAR63430.1 hypothetical protein [Candidatus Margulisiibacteriota bacterium]HCT85589.1 hypothetical protein [Candidatus Margulisiibacteriota bacterium]
MRALISPGYFGASFCPDKEVNACMLMLWGREVGEPRLVWQKGRFGEIRILYRIKKLAIYKNSSSGVYVCIVN